jgi:hypothetical protein
LLFVQVPFAVAPAHVSPALHAEGPQHTPSTQWPVGQVDVSVHATPSPSTGTHAALLQRKPGAQSPSIAHVVRHVLGPQA